MKLYRIHVATPDGQSIGYEFFRTKYDAMRRMREEEVPPDFEVIEVKPTKEGILHALNRFGRHADNG